MPSVAVFYPDGVGKIRGGVTVRNSAAMKKAEPPMGSPPFVISDNMRKLKS